jgi:hypothetical protein
MSDLTICPLCTKDFTPHNRLQKYCDTNCRNKANYKKHKRINRAELLEWIEMNTQFRSKCARDLVIDIYELLEFLGEDK